MNGGNASQLCPLSHQYASQLCPNNLSIVSQASDCISTLRSCLDFEPRHAISHVLKVEVYEIQRILGMKSKDQKKDKKV